MSRISWSNVYSCSNLAFDPSLLEYIDECTGLSSVPVSRYATQMFSITHTISDRLYASPSEAWYNQEHYTFHILRDIVPIEHRLSQITSSEWLKPLLISPRRQIPVSLMMSKRLGSTSWLLVVQLRYKAIGYAWLHTEALPMAHGA